MTKKVALFVENGSEELELIAPLDILRRANIHVDLISANNEDYITSSHDVKIIVDKKIIFLISIFLKKGIMSLKLMTPLVSPKFWRPQNN